MLAGGPRGFSRFVPRGSDTSSCWRWAGHSPPAGVGLVVRQSWRVLPRSADGEHAGGLQSLMYIRVLPPRHSMPRSWRARVSWPVIFLGEQTCLSEDHVHGTRGITSRLHWPAQECHPFSGGGRQACHPDPELPISWWESWASTGPRRKRGDVYVGVFWWVARLTKVKGVGVGAKEAGGMGPSWGEP